MPRRLLAVLGAVAAVVLLAAWLVRGGGDGGDTDVLADDVASDDQLVDDGSTSTSTSSPDEEATTSLTVDTATTLPGATETTAPAVTDPSSPRARTWRGDHPDVDLAVTFDPADPAPGEPVDVTIVASGDHGRVSELTTSFTGGEVLPSCRNSSGESVERTVTFPDRGVVHVRVDVIVGSCPGDTGDHGDHDFVDTAIVVGGPVSPAIDVQPGESSVAAQMSTSQYVLTDGDGGGAVRNLHIDFGDGTATDHAPGCSGQAIGEQASRFHGSVDHIWTTPGTYTVTIDAVTGDGCGTTAPEQRTSRTFDVVVS